ncbi:MAG: HU family DNA-binding protein [candidate division KSB1 bacterium]
MSAKIKYFTLADTPRKGSKAPQHSVEFLRAFVQETLVLIEEGLRRDGVVRLHEFGTFQLKWVNERRGRNPQTGAPLVIPGQYRVTFRPAAKVETRLNRRYAHLKSEIIETPPLPAQPKSQPLAQLATPNLKPSLEKNFTPIFIRPPYPPPPNRIRFDFAEEEQDNGYDEIEVGELEEVLSPAPRFDQAEVLTEPQPHNTTRVRWYGSFLMLLLFMLLAFTTPIHERASKRPASEVAQKVEVNLTPTDDATTPANGATKEQAKPPAFPGGTHLVAAGDNLWQISGRYYVDPFLWPNIYRVNTAVVSDPDVLEPQETLTLPVLHGPHDRLTPTDRHNLAEGYFLVFDYYRQTQKHLAPFALWAAVRYDPKILEIYFP